MFVVARVLQGAAGAGVLAAGLALVGDAFPDGAPRTRATGIWGAMLAAGIAVGPVLGAALARTGSWRTAYWVGAIAAVAITAASASLPASRRQARARRLDPQGAVAMSLAMGCLAAGLTSGRASWTSPVTIALLAGGVAALAVFVAVVTGGGRGQPGTLVAVGRLGRLQAAELIGDEGRVAVAGLQSKTESLAQRRLAEYLSRLADMIGSDQKWVVTRRRNRSRRRSIVGF